MEGFLDTVGAMTLIILAIIGLVAGWIAGRLAGRNTGAYMALGVAGAVLNDAALASSNIVSAGQVAWADISADTKAQAAPADEVVGRVMETYGAPAGE